MSDAPQENDQEQLNGSTEIEREEKAGKVAQEGSTADAVDGKEAAPSLNSEIEANEQVADKVVKQEEQSENEASETRQDGQIGTTPATEREDGLQQLGGDFEQDVTTNDAEPTLNNGPSITEEASTSAEPPVLPSPSLTHNSLRPLSPSSRTSTPPLTGNSVPAAAKKFSAINVNKKFLSKTGTTPSPSNASPITKLGSLSSRPISSPIPIAAPSSRLLSTKLTTVSSSKPSISPQPPSAASTSSPWAKPSLPPPVNLASGSAVSPMQQSANGRMTMGNSASMGSAQALGSARPAWRAVDGDGKRTGMGMSRDFPTAKEVADGKQASIHIAQAQAAQAAAILQGLDAFSHLDQSGHRWDDDDDDDDVIDFGGDPRIHPPPPVRQAPPKNPPPPMDQPVSKSERFAEDFDRSWPRSAQQAAAEEAPRPPDLRKRESDRVLFNASSNRLEPPASRSQATHPPQPTRLMSRTDISSTSSGPTQPPSAAGGRGPQRQPPPHLANTNDSGRQLPPHMADSASSKGLPAHIPHLHTREAWRNREIDHQPPPHLANRTDLPPPSTTGTVKSPNAGPGSALPPRRSFGQATATPMAPPPPSAHTPSAGITVDATESQAAEMHSAAEKARLRREAEEVERKAAAERAKQKAREMEIRLGLAPRPSPVADVSAQAKPPVVQQTPSYTIAQRPKPVEEPRPAPSTSTAGTSKGLAPSASRPAPGRPPFEQTRSREDQWRVRDTVKTETAPLPVPNGEQDQPAPRTRASRPTAESYFDAEPTPPQPIVETPQPGPSNLIPTIAEVQALFDEIPEELGSKKDYMFDDTLARIKAAMGGSKTSNANEQATSSTLADGTRSANSTLPTKPTAPIVRQPAPRPIVPEFFNITQPEIPRSPPPAWRTYTVKLPKESKSLSLISQPQLSALKRTRNPPRGWLMSFNPPLDFPPQSFSRTDVLLPAPNARRYPRNENPAPLVSISQGNLEPVHKKDTRRSSNPSNSHVDTGSSSINATAHQLQSRSAGRWRQTDEPVSTAPESISTQVAFDLLDHPASKPQVTAKPAPIAPAQESAGRYEAVAMGPAAKLAASAASVDPKSGVRFMVSSELEGDSLLDEVNKMSLETVEEAGMKSQPLGNSTDVETPRSPVSHSGPSVSRTHPSSPNGNVTWNTSHEHLKQVWQQAPQPSSDVKAAAPSVQPLAPEPSAGPLYPSLSSVSNTNPSSSQSDQTKLSYSSQTFSPTSAAFSSLRQSPGVGYAPSPSNAESMAGLSYARNQANVNGYSSMGQQGLWSSPGFGATPGYGYTAKSTNPIDQKAAMAFNAAGPGSTYLYGQASGYSSLPSAHSPYGQYSSQAQLLQQQQQQAQQHSARMSSSANGTYGYAGYTQSGSGGRSMSGRFAQTNGGNEYGQGEGGYYGYVGAGQSAQHAQHQAQAHNAGQAMYYPTSGAGSVGQGQAQAQAAGSQHTTHPAGTSSNGQRRKMW